MDGFWLIDKPKGWTSFDVVNKIRGIIKHQTGNKRPKVGHAGTLDPMATGLLIVLSGSYTKRQGEFMKQDKSYEALVRLGAVSDTDDAEGEIVKQQVESRPSESEVKKVMDSFLGKQMQTPPAYSALKIKGKPAYSYARAGQTPQLKPREIEVKTLELLNFDWPDIRLKTEVSSGTYIRALARDIGAQLDTGAYLAELKRLSIGPYGIDAAVGLPELMTNPAAYLNQA